VRKGSFYHFFKSKEELVIAPSRRISRPSRVDWDRIFSSSVPPIERLRPSST